MDAVERGKFDIGQPDAQQGQEIALAATIRFNVSGDGDIVPKSAHLVISLGQLAGAGSDIRLGGSLLLDGLAAVVFDSVEARLPLEGIEMPSVQPPETA